MGLDLIGTKVCMLEARASSRRPLRFRISYVAVASAIKLRLFPRNDSVLVHFSTIAFELPNAR